VQLGLAGCVAARCAQRRIDFCRRQWALKANAAGSDERGGISLVGRLAAGAKIDPAYS
jgi:hypothetical protein